MAKTIGKAAVKTRLRRIKDIREQLKLKVDELHVRLQRGNRKTGANCWTVSLLPVIDCNNCSECMWNCYDLKNDLMYKNTIFDRCRNSVIHEVDREKFWKEVDYGVKANYVTQLRINVGGDLSDDDFQYVANLGKDNPKTMFLFFTKNYKGINTFLADNSFPENVHPIMSAWLGVEMNNPYNLPCSHVLYEDGRTTAPEYGAIYCGGNCSECAFKSEGCWTLKQGEHVIFKVH